jgi:NTP pyrophosphatase (non-canonical NTP hydrolase)
MQFQELCKKVLEVYDRYAADNAITVSEDYAILKLVEEVGELAQAVIIQRDLCRTEKRVTRKEGRRAVANELADILGLTILVADRIGVDLQESLEGKWLHFLDDRPGSPARAPERGVTAASRPGRKGRGRRS